VSVLFLRMSEADRATYGGPEWVTFDIEALMDTPASTLSDWEWQTGVALWLAITELVGRSARAVRVALWIGLIRAGVSRPFADFDPATLRVQHRWRESLADSPAMDDPGKAEPEDAPEASPASSTGSTAAG
jgi:hypothetical protein